MDLAKETSKQNVQKGQLVSFTEYDKDRNELKNKPKNCLAFKQNLKEI